MSCTRIVMFLLITVAISHNAHCRHNRSHHVSQLSQLLQSNDNFFSKLTRSVQKIVNGIFDSLQLPNVFSKQPKIKALLKMLFNLNDISQEYFEFYDVLKNASDVDLDNMPINRMRVNDLIIKVLNEKEYDVSNETENMDYKNFKNLDPNQNSSSELGRDEEFKEFISGFLAKLRKLDVDDLLDEKDVAYMDERLDHSGRRNLNVWEPPSEDVTSTLNMQNRRIYGGKMTNILSYSFVASIHIMNEFVCAGSVISRDLIVTAASCLQTYYKNELLQENPKNVYVRVGSNWAIQHGDLIPVLDIYFYPDYETKTLNHNIALMRTKRPVHYHKRNKAKVRRILLDHRDGLLPSDINTIKILGWGAKKPTRDINDFRKLNYANLNIYPIEECKDIYTKEFVTDNHFCAGFMSKGNGACNRDTGGPGVVDNLLVGIVSFGAKVCGTSDSPTVFTRVGHYVDWIEHIINLVSN